jgi:hypothetical protein
MAGQKGNEMNMKLRELDGLKIPKMSKYAEFYEFLIEASKYYFKIMDKVALSSSSYTIYEDDKYKVTYYFCGLHHKVEVFQFNTKRKWFRTITTQDILYSASNCFEHIYECDADMLLCILDLQTKIPLSYKQIIEERAERNDAINATLSNLSAAFKELT